MAISDISGLTHDHVFLGEDHRRKLRNGLRRVASLAIPMNHVDAVVDADANECHHREHREQVELDARERQHARCPDEASKCRKQCEHAHSPISENENERCDNDDRSDCEALEELWQKSSGQLSVDKRKPGQRVRRIDGIDDGLDGRQVPGRFRKDVCRKGPFSVAVSDESADEIAESMGHISVIGQSQARIQQARDTLRKSVERAWLETFCCSGFGERCLNTGCGNA